MKAKAKAKVSCDTDSTYFVVKKAYNGATNTYADVQDTFTAKYNVYNNQVTDGYGTEYQVHGRIITSAPVMNTLLNADFGAPGSKAYMFVQSLNDNGGEFKHGVLVYGKNQSVIRYLYQNMFRKDRT